MKKTCLSLFLALSSVSAQGAISLAFSTGSNVSEGWATSTGDRNFNFVWGIVIDTMGDGFDGFSTASSVAADGGSLITTGATYEFGFSLTPTSASSGPTLPGGQLLSVGGAQTDDRLYISRNLSALVENQARLTQLTSMTMDGNTGTGDKYAIVWFEVSTIGSFANYGTHYGAWYKDGGTPMSATIMPADPGSYTTAGNGPAGMWGGNDSGQATKAATLTLIPEPSSALLGLLGASALLRRRRR